MELNEYRIISQQVQVDDGGAFYWRDDQFGLAQEVFIKLTRIRSPHSQVGVFLKVHGKAPSTSKGAIEVRYFTKQRKLHMQTRQPHE